MFNNQIYEDIARRTGGDIYVGVVGPVRTGKSTFIRKFAEQLIVPNVKDANKRAVLTDELPQAAEGKTVMTTEPKFVPGEAVGIDVKDNAHVRVRLIDCVGFMVEGAQGATEDGKPRLVSTRGATLPYPLTRRRKRARRRSYANIPPSGSWSRATAPWRASSAAATSLRKSAPSTN